MEKIKMSEEKEEKMKKLWEIFSNKIFEYHSKEIDKLTNQEKEEYDMPELEYKIYMMKLLEKKTGDKIEMNIPKHVHHKDFVNTWNKFMLE